MRREVRIPGRWGDNLQAEHERYLTEQQFKSPVILFDYPREIKPFYMRLNDDGKTVPAMDVLVPGSARSSAAASAKSGWTCSRRRCAVTSSIRPTTGGTWICAATAPCPTPASAWASSGCCMFVTGMANIRDVIPFPARRAARNSRPHTKGTTAHNGRQEILKFFVFLCDLCVSLFLSLLATALNQKF